MNEIVNQQKQTVQCRSTWCEAYRFCSHAKEHTERKDCFNCDPEERRQCPKCQSVEAKNNGF